MNTIYHKASTNNCSKQEETMHLYECVLKIAQYSYSVYAEHLVLLSTPSTLLVSHLKFILVITLNRVVMTYIA